MRAKRPKIPTRGPLSSALTTAACVASAGDSTGVVQLESAGALDVAELVLGEGEGVAAGTATAGAPGVAALSAAGAAGGGTAAVAAGPRAATGAGGAGLGVAGAGAGARAGACGGAGAGAGAGDVVGAGAGAPGAGAALVGGGGVEHCSGRHSTACSGPPDATEAVSASTEAASPGSTRVRRWVGRIMWLPLLDAQGSPAAGLSRVSSYTLPLKTKSLIAGLQGAARCAGISRLRRQLPRAAGAVLAAPATWAAAEAAGCPHPQARQGPFPPWWTGHPR